MGKWGEFEFNGPYDGNDIIKINDVVLQRSYV